MNETSNCWRNTEAEFIICDFIEDAGNFAKLEPPIEAQKIYTMLAPAA